MQKQLLLSLFLLLQFTSTAQLPTLQLDSLDTRMLLVHLYRAVDFDNENVGLWLPDSNETKKYPNAVNRKVSYTKELTRHYEQNQCTVYLMTFDVRYYELHSRFIHSDYEYFGKAIFVKNKQQWSLVTFDKMLNDLPELVPKIEVECIPDLSAQTILNTLYHAKDIKDSMGLYEMNDYELIRYNWRIYTPNKKDAKIYFSSTHYYQYHNNDYALIITAFEGCSSHTCAMVCGLTRLIKDAKCGWKILNHDRYWGGDASWGSMPNLDLVTLKMNGVDTKVLLNVSGESGQGASYNYDNYYSLENNFGYLFSYQSSFDNAGAVFNDNISNLYKMDYEREDIVMQNSKEHDFKLIYYKNGIFQKTEFYNYSNNYFEAETNHTDLVGLEGFELLNYKHLRIENIFVDSFYTLEYLDQYSGIDVEIFQLLNPIPITQESPSFLAPLYWREHFHLLFDKKKIFDLEKISQQYGVSINRIKCVNSEIYPDKFRDYFLLVPKH